MPNQNGNLTYFLDEVLLLSFTVFLFGCYSYWGRGFKLSGTVGGFFFLGLTRFLLVLQSYHEW